MPPETNSDSTSVATIETMSADDLRVAVRETHLGMRAAWVSQARAFVRIQKEELYRAWGFETWTAYLEGDLPGLARRAVNMQTSALHYLMAHRPELATRNHGAPPSYPAYRALEAMQQLEKKHALSRGTALEIDAEAVANLRDDVLDGSIGRPTVIKRAKEISKGITYRKSSGHTSHELALVKLANDVRQVAYGLSKLTKDVRQGRINTLVGVIVHTALIALFARLIRLFGPQGIERYAALAMQQIEEEKKNATELRLIQQRGSE